MQNIKINPLIHPNLLNNTFDKVKPIKIHVKPVNNKYAKFIINVVLPVIAIILLCFVLKNKYMEKKNEIALSVDALSVAALSESEQKYRNINIIN